MSCEPERVTALVDGALEGEERARIEAHVARCEVCRVQAADERALRARLRALPAPEVPFGLEQRVRAKLRRRHRWPGTVRALLPLAAVLVLALWARGYAPFVAWELSRDHDHCFGRPRLPAQVWASEPDLLIAWFDGKGDRLPLLPSTAGRLALVGGRHCWLPDASRAAHVYYTSDDQQLSVFVVSHGVRMDDDFATSSGGNAVALVRLGGRVVGVVGEDHGDVSAFVTGLRTSVAALGTQGPAPASLPAS
ncbi:MAG: zf-HC2 domain-containing protein [Acidobacteria bacterium]|nr:zf-HC2 domain-containing protein [Acidobacteriota bacterium]